MSQHERKARRVREPDDNDLEVGRRIRTLRLDREMTQTELAKAIGVKFQMVQKYEKGKNRVGAGRLQRIASALEVNPSYFFPNTGAATTAHTSLDLLIPRAAFRLVKAYVHIPDAAVRRSLVTLAEQLACAPPSGTKSKAAERFAAEVLAAIRDIQAMGIRSRKAIAEELERRGIKTARGGRWSHVTVGALLDRAT